MKEKYLSLAGIMLSSGLLSSPLYARLVDESFFNSMNDMFEVHTKALARMKNTINTITHEIEEDDEKVIISFTGFENLTKDDVKVVKQGNEWLGTITVPAGRVEFLLSPRGLRVSSKLEVKREQKTSTPEQDKEALIAQEKSGTLSERFYSSSSATEYRSFTSVVDTSTLEAKPVQSDSFILTVKKQKEIVLPIV